MSACVPFRAELERALAGSPDALARLARHEHALVCAQCRVELLRERALESLLARLPAPEIPSALAERVLARLADERADETAPATTPAHSRLEDGELDDLLARLPTPRPPAGLADRVLQRVAPAREPRRVNTGRRSLLLLAAAMLLAALTVWGWSAFRSPARRIELAQGSGVELEADEDLLAYAVEHWELLHDEDLDLWLASLDPVDELLIEYADEETLLDEGSRGAGTREGD